MELLANTFSKIDPDPDRIRSALEIRSRSGPNPTGSPTLPQTRCCLPRGFWAVVDVSLLSSVVLSSTPIPASRQRAAKSSPSWFLIRTRWTPRSSQPTGLTCTRLQLARTWRIYTHIIDILTMSLLTEVNCPLTNEYYQYCRNKN